jgi:hypothetical protein
MYTLLWGPAKWATWILSRILVKKNCTRIFLNIFWHFKPSLCWFITIVYTITNSDTIGPYAKEPL